MTVLVPEWVEANLERARWTEGESDAQRRIGGMWTQMVQELDPLLSVVWAGPGANLPGIIPERWHVKRTNPNTIDTYMPITGPGGSYREPASDILEELRARDMHSGQALKAAKNREILEEARKVRHLRLNQEQATDHIAEDYRAARRVAGENLTGKKWARGSN